jgi:hypothetical protein
MKQKEQRVTMFQMWDEGSTTNGVDVEAGRRSSHRQSGRIPAAAVPPLENQSDNRYDDKNNATKVSFTIHRITS